jgi:hypothetical protein
MGITYSVYIDVAVLTMIGILLQPEELIAACVYLIPYVSVMPVAYITCFFAFIWFVKEHRYRHLCINGDGVVFIVLAVFEMLHIVVGHDSFNAILNIFLYIFIAIVINSAINYKDAIYIINSYTLGVVLFVAELVIYEILYKGISLSQYLLSINRLGQAVRDPVPYQNMYAGPNFLALCISVAVALQIYLWVKLRKTQYFINSIAAVFGGLLTQSKQFIVAMAFLVIVYLGICVIQMEKNRLRKILLWGIGILLLATKFKSQYIDYLIDHMIYRFQVNGMSSRDILFYEYCKTLASNLRALVWGVGIQDVFQKLSLSHNPHSMVIEVLSAWGIIGIFVLFVMFLAWINNNSRRFWDISNMPLLVLLFTSQASRLFNSSHVMLCLVVYMVYQCTNKKELEGGCKQL